MAEPVRKRGPRSRGGGVGRGARGARGRRPRAQRSPARRTPDSVFVDLVSDSDDDILEVVTARGAADLVEVPPPEPPVPAAPRDDSDSDSEGADAQPAGPPRELVRRRRRLLLDPGEAPVVPVYSGKVKSSLHLIPDHLSLLKLYPPGAEEEVDMEESSSPHPEDPPFPGSPWKKKLRSKDEEEEKKKVFLDRDTSPLPPPPPRTKSRKHTRALQKLREVNKRLQDLRSTLSPKQQQGQDLQSPEDEVVLVEGPTLPETPRLFPLKIRCRADLVRLPVRMVNMMTLTAEELRKYLRPETCVWGGGMGVRGVGNVKAGRPRLLLVPIPSRSPCRVWWTTWPPISGCPQAGSSYSLERQSYPPRPPPGP
ncbi:NFATC2-interacting protein isoform X2 [Microcebus murinus]|uniref:NFATC2-interacting protein isoform X2 n=1 Tax=Microcebus murinus TaxID=30608 RepID=UPI003F6B559F